MERSKESAVWRFFTLASPTSPTALCNICKRQVSRGGDNVTRYNTTNLIRHLQKHHAKEHAEFVQLTNSKGKSTTKQATLADTLLRQEKLPTNSIRAQKITARVMEFIVLGLQPLNIVENVGFRRLMDYLEPRYIVPSRKYVSETALPELYSKVRKQISGELKCAKVLSFTTDIWTSDVSPMSLLSLTVHWLNPTCEHRSAMLGAKNFRGSHTSDAIATALTTMIDEWEIPFDKVHVMLSDNAANMKKAMGSMKVCNLGCFAHTLQLIVNEGLLSQRSLNDALTKCRQIIGHFKHSQLSYSRLHDIQIEMQMQPKRLQQDIKTRWNSTYYMMQSLLEQKRALSAYVADHDLPATLTSLQWALLERAMIVLAPFEELTRKVSSSTASAADVIPAVTVLKRILGKESDCDSGIKTMKTTLLQAVNNRFSAVEDEPLYALATLLDPRYKDRYFTGADFAKKAKDALIKELEEEELRSTTSDATDEAEPPEKVPHVEAAATTLAPPPAAAAPSSKSSFMQEFEQILVECEEPGAASTSSIAVQVQTYYSEKTVPASDDPYQYWGVNRQRFPALAAVATKYLCAPCTSVESERLFSTVSNIMDEKRNRLTADRVEMLAFLSKNLLQGLE
ncbi:zinc finger BED domain-containing protein 4-like [Brachyhypopomus gauderio]|uniref:zinc finger BED domain-containing protein 4-like n=1 Tax=Brachyhypopomus gauderio TaxID=698409 RepID=UPI00404237BA